MAWNRVRPIALALVRRDDELLVGRHEADGSVFYRPLGGGIEVGEYAEEAVAREIQEELGWTLAPVGRRGVVENIFTYRGEQGHEIVFVVEAAFTDEAAYRQEVFVAEDDQSPSTLATWIPISQLVGEETTLYPTGLAELLRT